MKVPIVRMFFAECVFGVHGKGLASVENIREFFDDQFKLFTAEFGAEPDNESRDLVHGVRLLEEQNTRSSGGRQVQKPELSIKTEDKKIKIQNF